jgi:aryl-alcohol dehydrogenase-like predicted oxidoreductase
VTLDEQGSPAGHDVEDLLGLVERARLRAPLGETDHALLQSFRAGAAVDRDPLGGGVAVLSPRFDGILRDHESEHLAILALCERFERIVHMISRPLGGSGLEVSRLILGCGNFGGIGSAPQFFGQGESEEEAYRLMDAAWDLGINVFDTADAYGGGRSETWIGRWRTRTGNDVVLSTKVFHSVEGDPSDRGLSRERILRQIDGSLRRLGVEQVDMYLIHEPDPETPLEETLDALDELVRAGKVRAIGASNVDRAWLEQAAGRVQWVQNSYSLLDRESEDVLAFCAEQGLGFTPFSPLAGGWLAGRYRRGEPRPPGSRMTTRPEPYLHLDDEAVYSGLDRFAAAASRRDVDMATLAFAWLLGDSRVTAVVVGPRRPEHLEPGLAALDLELTPAERDELASLFP